MAPTAGHRAQARPLPPSRVLILPEAARHSKIVRPLSMGPGPPELILLNAGRSKCHFQVTTPPLPSGARSSSWQFFYSAGSRPPRTLRAFSTSSRPQPRKPSSRPRNPLNPRNRPGQASPRRVPVSPPAPQARPPETQAPSPHPPAPRSTSFRSALSRESTTWPSAPRASTLPLTRRVAAGPSSSTSPDGNHVSYPFDLPNATVPPATSSSITRSPLIPPATFNSLATDSTSSRCAGR